MIKNFECLPNKIGCFPLVVVMVMTANGRHPHFWSANGLRTKFFEIH